MTSLSLQHETHDTVERTVHENLSAPKGLVPVGADLILENPTSKRRPFFAKWNIWVLAAIVSVLCAQEFFRAETVSQEKKETVVQQASSMKKEEQRGDAERREVQRKVDTIIRAAERTKSKNDKVLLNRYVNDVNSILRADSSSSQKIVSAVAELTEMKNALICVTLNIRDKISGKTEMEEFVFKFVQPLIDDGDRKAREVETALIRLEDGFQKNAEIYNKTVLANFEQIKNEYHLSATTLQDFYLGLLDFSDGVRGYSQQLTLNSVGMISMLYFAKPAISTIRIIFRSGTGLILRSSAAAGISVAADGPLPFGDILGVFLEIGGVSWAAYDIYDALDKLKPALTTQFEDLTASLNDNLRTSALVNGEKLFVAYQHHKKTE